MGIIVKRFIQDIAKYKEYLLYNTKSELKSQVANTILGYLWWLLDPLLHMLVYTVMVTVIFQRDQPDFPVFVFCGLLMWKWFTATIMNSSTCIKAKTSILQQVYIPKFILPLAQNIVNFIKFLFGFIILFVMLFVFKISITIHFLEIIFVIFSNFLFVYGTSLLIAHFGVFFKDLKNILTHFIRLWWYMSPGMYSISRIPDKWRFLWWLNPNTTYFESYRNVIMYGKHPLYGSLLIWTIVSIIMIYIGLDKLYKFDKNYSKIV